MTGNNPGKLITWHLHLSGQVQGVGFRPFVYRLATAYGLQGWVNNGLDGVHLEFLADAATAESFRRTLIDTAPAIARITGQHLTRIAPACFDHFQIRQSAAAGPANLLLTPDFALCATCRTELSVPENRRQGYPFTTCTWCGPRYSIVRTLPYDREHTTMAPFQQCPSCQAEYDDPRNRRYFSQTNSCPQCAVQLRLVTPQGQSIGGDPAALPERVVQAWRAGKIVALKGIGGYLLTCAAQNAVAVATLRQRKQRPTKPFALMYPDLETLQRTTTLHQDEVAVLTSPVSPIVLLPFPYGDNEQLARQEIAPHLPYLGVMLPYTPLYALLLRSFGQPIVATSGNPTNAPIVFEDEQALTDLPKLADFILLNNRDIAVPQDDSVVYFTPQYRQQIILRRARGWAPAYVNARLHWPTRQVLATGAELKSTFSLLHQGNTYISQYLGDLADYDTVRNYQHTLQHLLRVLHTQPEVVISDQHPGYAATQYAEKLARELGIPHVQIQHHVAHFGAILGEHQLVASEVPVLGIIWDGTGLGDDGQIWGGECFVYARGRIERRGHLAYFTALLGDKMAREPRLSALAVAGNLPGSEQLLAAKFTPQEWQLYTRMLNRPAVRQTSSMGRLFDAVAALLGLLDRQTYEGEAAQQLEIQGRTYLARQQEGLATVVPPYLERGFSTEQLPVQPIVAGIIADLLAEQTQEFIAARFHLTLVQLVRAAADNLKIKRIAFSGGVFQNGLLVDLMIHHLATDFELFFHEQLSPNDENISFGQLVGYQIELQQNGD